MPTSSFGSMFGFMRKEIITVGAIGISMLGLVDWVLKHLAIERFADGHSAHLLPFVDAFLHQNLGIAFNIPIPISIIAILTIGILLFLIDRVSIMRTTDPGMTLGTIAVIVGASNNLVDRLTNGFTTDYLMLFNTSIINGSDVLIVLGVGSIFWYTRNNPHTLRNFIQPSPPNYGVISRMFRGIVRVIRNSRYR